MGVNLLSKLSFLRTSPFISPMRMKKMRSSLWVGYLFHVYGMTRLGYEANFIDLAVADAFRITFESKDSASKLMWESINYARDVPYTRLMRYTFAPESVATDEIRWKLLASEVLSQYCVEFPFVNPRVSAKKVPMNC